MASFRIPRWVRRTLIWLGSLALVRARLWRDVLNGIALKRTVYKVNLLVPRPGNFYISGSSQDPLTVVRGWSAQRSFHAVGVLVQ